MQHRDDKPPPRRSSFSNRRPVIRHIARAIQKEWTECKCGIPLSYNVAICLAYAAYSAMNKSDHIDAAYENSEDSEYEHELT
jgi:hypothetical protein